MINQQAVRCTERLINQFEAENEENVLAEIEMADACGVSPNLPNFVEMAIAIVAPRFNLNSHDLFCMMNEKWYDQHYKSLGVDIQF